VSLARRREGGARGAPRRADSWPAAGQECHNPREEVRLDAALATHVFHRALLVSDQQTLRALVAELREHESAEELVERALVPAMARLGTEWAQGLLHADVVASAGRTAEFVADLLAPPPAPVVEGAGRVAVASLDDVHTLGKRLVMGHLAATWLERPEREEEENPKKLIDLIPGPPPVPGAPAPRTNKTRVRITRTRRI